MASTNDYVEYVCEQIRGTGEIRYRKMFGDYMIYVNDKPLILVCDDIPFVKMLDCIKDRMQNAETGYPYDGAKEHYILDIEDRELCEFAIAELEKVTPIPKPKQRKTKAITK